MEKNKGLFSFRKHPVGDSPDGKKGRKRKGGRLRRSIGFLLAAALIFNTLPASGLAVSASEQEKGLCEHHTEHTPECGYAEAQPCTHEHTEEKHSGEECYKTVTECVHEHTDGCYPETEESTGEGNATTSDAGNREPSKCTHSCSEESGCITKVLDCHHEHDENCGYQEAQDCGYVCEICNGTEPEDTKENTENTEAAGTDTAECICETLCTEDSINGDCPVCGADDASFLDCKGKVPEENTENQEDTGICKHHQEHDADCGYIPKSEDGEGSPCTYECRICPIEDLIAALPEQVTEDNADDVRAQLEEILALYGELNEDEQEQIDLSRIYALQGALDAANAPTAADGLADQQADDEASVEIDGVTTYYATLEEAFDAANGKTATITMLNDAECVHSGSNGSPLNINSGIVILNLNGNTLSGKGYGDYGIINVSGGSLLVQGEEGKVKVTRIGLSCRGSGKLTVEGITLELIGDDIAVANAGIDNEGGTVILNGTKMTGAASVGQIYHHSGTTTINNVTATGTTDSCPESVMYYSEGTLTINGGAFDKIAVDSGNYGGVQSVAELLGEGCAYKKQDGTWATDDELAGLEISNVTVEKIPLTINPKGDTSWYYSTQQTQTHTLAMNAAPVNGSDSVTYVWKNGNEKLDCTSDAYTVPAGTPVGSYTYTCEATCDGYTLSHTFTFKIEQSGTEFTGGIKTYNGSEETTSFSADDTITVKATPTATGTTPQKAAARLRADPAAGQMALFVGDVQVSEPVQAGEGGTYIMTVSAAEVLLQGNAKPNGNAVTLTAKFVGNDNMADAAGTVDVNISAMAMAEKNGTVIGYYGESNLASAFAAENTGATVTLLKDVDLGENDLMLLSGTFTLDCGAFTLSSSSEYFVIKLDNADLTFAGGTIQYNGTGNAVLCATGAFTMTGGTLNAASDYALNCAYGGKANIQGGTVGTQGKGLCIGNPDRVELSGGTYATICIVSNYGAQKVPLSTILADGRAAYGPDGPITRDTVDAELTGPIIVKECEHDGVKPTSNNDGTHALKCPYCGYSEAAANCTYVFSGTTGTCAACGDSVTVAVSGTDNLIYDGTGKELEVTVMRAGTELTAGTDYMVAYADNINSGTAKVTVTIGNNQGTYNGSFTIGKTTPTITWSSTTQELTYTGQQAVITAPTVTLENNENFGGTISYSYKKQGETDYKDGLPTDAGTYTIKAHVDAEGNYNAADSTNELTLTISYMDAPGLQYNDSDKKDYYNRDVAVTAVSAGGHTYTVSDTLGGNYEASYTISAQEGTVTKILYFKDEAGHMSDGVEVTVKFDLTPPTGEIAVGAKWWQNVLHFISFGNYAAKEYAVTIKAEDKNGSGISKIEYVIVTGSSQYTDVGALTSAVQESEWKEYDSSNRPTVSANTSQYVVYARLTDNVGNATYISTDGILLDSTAPTVSALTVPEETKKDVAAGVTFTVSETADYYYVVLPQGSAAPSAEDIIVTCGGTLPDGGTGTAIVGSVDSGKGAVSGDAPSVSVDVKNLQPNTAYMVYVTAVDRALDITNSADGTPAGNIADVVNTGFTTKKTLPVITKAPAVAGTYGQSVGEMTITGGTAQAGSTVLAGTWAASDTDRNKKPSAGTAEVTVIFTPESDIYDSVSVQAPLTVSQRNLNAKGVTVSEVAGNYTYTGSEIKPPVAVDTGTPTSGISISDSEAALTANDFTVSYSNNKDAGTASVTITGKGNYTGLVTKTFAIAKASGREVPDLTGSYTDNGQTYTYTVTLTEGAVYRMGNDGKWQEGNVFEGITPGTSVTFYAKMPETGNYEDGTPKSITVDFPKLTPAAPALSYTRQMETGTGETTITITPVEGAEYSFDGGATWKSGEGANVQGGFTTSDTVTLAIRLKGTDTHNQSPVQTVTVDLAKKDKGAPPAFSLKAQANGETDYTVTIPPTEGCEYSFDGETWSDNNVKTGVSVGEIVTGYKRYKETDDYNASSAVSAKETMPKFMVKTPVISPAGGSYSGSISVTITCGSTDAEIYYTTDGSTPGRSSTRYTGAFTVSVPATVKAVAIKDGLDDSAVATASYKKKSGGGSGGGNSGGSSGGNKNNGGSGGNDEGQGSGGGGSTNPGNGNTTPQPFVTQPTDTNTSPGNESAPGTGTTPVNPGSGNTVKPGTAPDSGTGTPAQGTKQPFIKGADGKIGWDVIRAEEEQAQEGSTINVDMNGSVVVPGDIFDRLKGKDITITFDMGNGILWSVGGKSITTDKAGDIDFSVQTGVNTVPVDIVNNITGECYSIQISLAHEGEFGFTAVLSIGLGKENAGYTASLYYYNESAGELEFICSDEVAENGTVSLAFTHASDYVIAINGGGEEENSMEEMAQPQAPAGTEESAGDIPKSPQTGQEKKNVLWPIVAGIIALAGVVFAGVFVWKKKEGNGSVKEGK